MFNENVSDGIINEALPLPSPAAGAYPIAVGGCRQHPGALLRAGFVGIYWAAQVER